MKSNVLPLLRAGLATATVSALLSGCAAFSESTSTADDGELRVVTSLYPLEYVVTRVAGDDAEISNLSQPGQDPHDLELTPAETAGVIDADLVVFEAGFQASMDAAVEQADGVTTVDAAEVAGLEPIGHEEGHVEEEGHEGETAEEHAEHAEEGHEGETAEEHGEHGDVDPHFWHDPLRMAAVADAVAEALAEVDPDNASAYSDNAAALRDDLETLDEEFTTGLAQCDRDTVVVSHDAFGYLTRYGLHMEPIAGLSPDAEPTPADLGRLQQLIATEGVTTVFGERLVPVELSQQLANDAGVTTAVLDPLEGLTDETADEDYLSLMRANLDALRTANGCR